MQRNSHVGPVIAARRDDTMGTANVSFTHGCQLCRVANQHHCAQSVAIGNQWIPVILIDN
jgi:hypothetical protein